MSFTQFLRGINSVTLRHFESRIVQKN